MQFRPDVSTNCVFFCFLLWFRRKVNFCEWSRSLKNCLTFLKRVKSAVGCDFGVFNVFVRCCKTFWEKNWQRLTSKGFENVWIAQPKLHHFWKHSRRVWQGVRSWQAPDWPKTIPHLVCQTSEASAKKSELPSCSPHSQKRGCPYPSRRQA